jgi:hypothetical protein
MFRFWLNHHQWVRSLCFAKLLFWYQLIYFFIKIVWSCGRMPLCAYCVQCFYAALHTVLFVHGYFAGKCILTGSTEQRYFKLVGSMEKKWDTVIPADLKRLYVNGTYISRWSRNHIIFCPTLHAYNTMTVPHWRSLLNETKFMENYRIFS